MIPIISIVGNSKVGKTTLLEKVVSELKRRGYRVAVIKHAHHSFDMDHPGTDSWRLAKAGSDIVVVSSPGGLAFIERVNKELYLNEIIPLLNGRVDIILTEGYKQADTAKVYVSASKKNDVDEVIEFIENQVSQSRTVEGGKSS